MKQTLKLRTAQKYSVPVVNENYITDCKNKQKILPTYLYAPIPPKQNNIATTFTNEKTPHVQRAPIPVPKKEPIPYDSLDDKKSQFSIVLQHFFLQPCTKIHSNFCALELHVNRNVLNQSHENEVNNYRVFQQTGNTKELIINETTQQNQTLGNKKIYLLSSIGEAESLYQSLYKKYTKQLSFQKLQFIAPNIGSGLQSSFLHSCDDVSLLLEPTQKLVSVIYEEAQIQTDKLLQENQLDSLVNHSPFGSLSLQNIEEGESILIHIVNHLKRYVKHHLQL